ncbi:hypothetical protein [Floridanema evergladense]|uniref:Uncharacterized protein n=1 Tax=Floridaenema evergladense BLCC-F167 TaxID=3153639 RepID=A0ABV4WND0_9CYAN
MMQIHNLDSQVSDVDWNSLCWLGYLQRYASDVMFAGEKAVELEPNEGDWRDSRGLARALTGDVKDAIEDFQIFIAQTDDEMER